MSVDEFIKERETPYSKITNVKVNDDGIVSYTEKYDLTHPMCPLVKGYGSESKILVVNHVMAEETFKILYGSVDILPDDDVKQTTRAFVKDKV